MHNAVLVEELHALGYLLSPLHSVLSELLDVFGCYAKSSVGCSVNEHAERADGMVG